ncbi:23S rRNA (uracil(1939)-C(5))-methyltransferase RlmD [Aerococcaceae bacterium DSM 111022]|nr:23S rRNA (uracil(1939)-C(5))-methyltransferase RlmD [Aerococcaceae bacterium DSM 111022]
MATDTHTLKKNEYYDGVVVDLTSKGQGVVKIDNYPFFIEGVIPGEKVHFKAIKLNKKYGFGRLIRIDESSPDRVEITDPVGRQIGTMTLQHMSYDAQLQFKQKLVRDAFYKLGGFEDIEVRPTIGMEEPWGYRNKAQIPVRDIKGQLETGFYRRGTHNLIPVENFYIQDPEIDKIIVTIRDIMREYHVQPYDEKTVKGELRHIIVKRGHYTGQVMVTLVLNRKSLRNQQAIVEEIVEQVPGLVSLVANINTKNTNVILGKENKVLWGQEHYEDEMLGLTLRISPNSFYQVNTIQAERLYQEAINAAGLTGTETVLDAYSGIGSISLALARETAKVYAMEVVPEAIEMAEHNAALNEITNATFEVGKAEEVLPKWHEEGIKFDVAVVDPPRKGLDEAFIETLVTQQPERIVYVSCNPATCARDCRLIADAGYEIQHVQPVDLFCQTTHTESVVLLTKSKAM